MVETRQTSRRPAPTPEGHVETINETTDRRTPPPPPQHPPPPTPQPQPPRSPEPAAITPHAAHEALCRLEARIRAMEEDNGVGRGHARSMRIRDAKEEIHMLRARLRQLEEQETRSRPPPAFSQEEETTGGPTQPPYYQEARRRAPAAERVASHTPRRRYSPRPDPGPDVQPPQVQQRACHLPSADRRPPIP
ncbi:uncharacterized protein LOC130731839 [Lotus japonicus]|uniref:uncharacterized protein LOC130731839 n=1 Tax=Lotus japonicus TaxID=34305 RepID=UPI002584FD02|nr:uncharacterized protein LOC130731839 [Lotus japonicus]